MKAKNYLDILKYGLYGSFICFLLVFSTLLFPFITSKQIIFNILMELLLILWVVFMIKFPAYRPKKSYLTYGILAYFGVMLLSCFLGVDFNLSFWGNAERSLGFFHIAHFLIFYLIAITVLRSKKDWSNLINVFLGTAMFLVFNSFLKGGPAATLGNTAYMAGVMIFGVFFGLWQLFKSNKLALRWLYSAVTLLSFVGFWRSDISGAQAGMFVGLVVFGACYVFLNNNKKHKIIGASALSVLIVAVVLLFAFRSSSMLVDTKVGKALNDFSSKNTTLNTRLLSWRSAALDFKDHPFFGVGHGNYAIVFDKHFDPHFYDYTTESYFDRAHNNIVEIASTLGLVGLLAYLALLVAAFYYLVLAWRGKKISALEFSLLAGLIMAYFVQDLALFDSLVTYVLIFSTFGLIYYSYNQFDIELIDSKESEKADITPEREFLWLAVFSVVMIIFIYNFNIKGLVMYSGVIDSYTDFSQGDVDKAIAEHQAAIKGGAPYNRDSRSIFFGLIISNYQAIAKLPVADRDKIMEYGLALSEANVAYNPKDSLMNMQLSQLYSIAARFNFDNVEKISKYSFYALENIEAAITASPGRIPLYFNKADILFMRGENDQAIATIKAAIDLKPNYPDGYCQLANVDFFLKDYDNAYANTFACASYGGANILQEKDLITQTIKKYSSDATKQEVLSVLKNELNK